MSKKIDATKSLLDIQASTFDFPFREFRDNELSADYWGMGPIAFKAALRLTKGSSKTQSDHVWVDEQVQPLPRSLRKHLQGWVRAEDLARNQWDAEVTVFEDNNGGVMSPADIQLTHYQVLHMSSFCRRVLSMCFILERVEGLTVEHQWENFVFNLPPEGWRARYHIYSPGMKHGGGQQHRPVISKNGCYLVRLYHIGAWRCVWVNDQVPVDASDAPLLPFAPVFCQSNAKPTGKQAAPAVIDTAVQLWPLLLCKALLKLAAPEMASEDDLDNFEDETMDDFDILHALTGAFNLTYHMRDLDGDQLWKVITSEVQLFAWDDDDETFASTVKSKAKKPGNKEASIVKRRSFASIFIDDTRNMPPFILPGIAPAFEMNLLINMARDLPLKKPLDEPEVALWKQFRWVDWMRKHGLYEAYECPRTRFLKLNGLLKLSLAPHLLDVQSTESITFGFREEHGRTTPVIKKVAKEGNRSVTTNQTMTPQLREELREWVQFDTIKKVIKSTSVLHYPSMYQLCSIASNPPIRITKSTPNKELDIPAPKNAPLYLQIDNPEESNLKILCSMLHPRVLLYGGVPKADYVEPGYVIIEKFDWFVDCELPKVKTSLKTRGYDATEVTFKPGRHFCRLWIYSRVPWYVMLLSESTIHVGTRDVIQQAAVRECPWVAKFLNNLGTAFQNLLRANKSSLNLSPMDREFYRSYQPDLDWNPVEVGFSKSHLHWMFRQALQTYLGKRLLPFEFQSACSVLQHYLYDPDFGLSEKAFSSISLKNFMNDDPCDCSMPDAEELEILGVHYDTILEDETIIDAYTKNKLLRRVCETTADDLPCGVLQTLRDKIYRRYEAATCIQAHWRGFRARKCLASRVPVTPEIMKCLMDNAFGNLEALTALMNEFFHMYPGAKHAYSVASALAGTCSLKQYQGTTHLTTQCAWIPFFQGVFYCHALVKVHFDLQSTIGTNNVHSNIEVYNNDIKEQLPQAYTTHLTMEFSPNIEGYTVIGHGTYKQQTNVASDIHWQLNVMSSIANVFHICDNETDQCKELPLHSATKLHVEEVFVPNQRNIISGIQISITKAETISFRAAASSSDLEMEAVLRTTASNGELKELVTCSGRGELYWPYIRLQPSQEPQLSTSHANMPLNESGLSSFRSQRSVRHAKPLSAGVKVRSSIKVKEPKVTQELKTNYTIEVRAPNGWPLTVKQWRRVIEIQNSQEYKTESPSKKTLRISSVKEKEKIEPRTLPQPPVTLPQPGDAYVEMECAFSAETGITVKRDDSRELKFAAAVRSWEANEPSRNAKGALLRQEIRTEFLESESIHNIENTDTTKSSEVSENATTVNLISDQVNITQQGPTPVTVSQVSEANADVTKEIKYLTMPDELKDKFKPLDFVPSCTKEKIEEECIIITPEIAEQYRIDRQACIEAAKELMDQLQTYNDINVLGAQKTRIELLENLLVDSQFSPALIEALEARDEAIQTYTQIRDALTKSVSNTRKKQEGKKK